MRLALVTALVFALTLPALAADKEKSKPKEKEAPASKVPRLSKQPVGTCGVSVYAPEGFAVQSTEKSPDGADVITAEAPVGNHRFGVICVKFTEGMPTDGDELEGILVAYLDYLKGTLKIQESAGYGKGHRLEKVPGARGVIDYWKDEDGDEWKVKGWVTPTHLAAIFVYGKGEYPIANVREMFLDGFREE